MGGRKSPELVLTEFMRLSLVDKRLETMLLLFELWSTVYKSHLATTL